MSGLARDSGSPLYTPISIKTVFVEVTTDFMMASCAKRNLAYGDKDLEILNIRISINSRIKETGSLHADSVCQGTVVMADICNLVGHPSP